MPLSTTRDPDRSPDATDLSDALDDIDLAELGCRIRTLRLRAGLTQAQVVGAALSVAYLSRIESGQRRPNLKALRVIARGMRSSPHEVLLGMSALAWSERRVELDWAHLALRTGDPVGALARTSGLVEQAPAHTELGRGARLVHALALEATGDFERATMMLEELAERPDDDGEPDLGVLTALTRCYRQAGELGRAIEVGRQAQSRLTTTGMDGSPEAVRLVLTLAAAHAEVGDVGYASRLCQKAMAAADRLGSPHERAGCYWNASILESRRGRSEEAIDLARRAMHLLDETESARNAARLRTNLGLLYLRLEEPDVDAAEAHLVRAAGELEVTDSNVVDRATNLLGRARARFVTGAAEEAEVAALEALDQVTGIAPLVAAEVLALLGQVAQQRGEVTAARRWYDEAVAVLEHEDDDRHAAQLWFELGALCLEAGSQDVAVRAFQRAGSAVGLRAAASRRSTPGVTQGQVAAPS